jgi:uncharacterized protein (TIGR00251 family)
MIIMQNTDNYCIKIHVYPNSKKTEFLGFDKKKEGFVFRLKSKPTEGKANEELLKFIKKEFKITVKIVRGLKSRDKIISLDKPSKPFT